VTNEVNFDFRIPPMESFSTTLNAAVSANQQGSTPFFVFQRTLVHSIFPLAFIALEEAAEDTTTASSKALLLQFIAEFFFSANRVHFAHKKATLVRFPSIAVLLTRHQTYDLRKFLSY
jgi:hypothetical protein